MGIIYQSISNKFNLYSMLLHAVMYQNFLVATIEACIRLLGPIKSIAFKEYLQLSSCNYEISFSISFYGLKSRTF